MRNGKTASDLVFGLLIFFGIVSGLGIFASDIAGQYNYTNSTFTFANYTNISGMETQAKTLSQTISNASTANPNILTYFFLSADAINAAMQYLFQLPISIYSMVNSAAVELSLPGFVVPLVAVATILTIVFTIIGAAMRKEV